MKRKKSSSVSRRQFLKGAAAVGSLVASKKASAADDSNEIAYAKIHPGIGIARVGNSEEFFIGPELIDPEIEKNPDKQTHDKKGAIRRQAAQFRIYGYNSRHEVVRELTAADANIVWHVHMANKKADWFRFIVAMDLKEAKDLSVIRRNAEEPNRSSLIIDPGLKSIKGVNAQRVKLDGGKFLDIPVSLGELRTDAEGRLQVLSALGKSAAPHATAAKPLPVYDPEDPDTFNNADGWYDDTGDGPVTATVTLNNAQTPLKVEGAWVAVAPPNFAPHVIGWRTLYDLLVDTYIKAGWMDLPKKSSFTNDILPILRRISNLQWVNKGIAIANGNGKSHPLGTNNRNKPIDFEDKNFIAELAEGGMSATQTELREKIFNLFRTAGQNTTILKLLPALYGDAYGFSQESPNRNFIVNGITAIHLQRWTKGEFINDWGKTPEPERDFNRIHVSHQPAMLDRAALHYCLADAFHPGCELTWPMRWISMYSEKFRIKARDPNAQPPKWESAAEMTHQLLFKSDDPLTAREDGPLGAQSPGDLTKWMALPWQGDTVFCRSGYEPKIDPYILTYWPARVPNHVLSEDDYNAIMRETNPEKRKEIFAKRVFWTRNLHGSAADQILQMVRSFSIMGVIEARPGPADDQDLPGTMFVEVLSKLDKSRSLPQQQLESAAPPQVAAPNLPETETTRAGWTDEAQLEEFRDIRFRRKKKK